MCRVLCAYFCVGCFFRAFLDFFWVLVVFWVFGWMKTRRLLITWMDLEIFARQDKQKLFWGLNKKKIAHRFWDESSGSPEKKFAKSQICKILLVFYFYLGVLNSRETNQQQIVQVFWKFSTKKNFFWECNIELKDACILTGSK